MAEERGWPRFVLANEVSRRDTSLAKCRLRKEGLLGYKAAMKLTWHDAEDLAEALARKFPDQDPLRLSFPKLHRLVCELEGFGDDPRASNERLLESIQMAWHEATQ
jgi:FeS assembly protein IscX